MRSLHLLASPSDPMRVPNGARSILDFTRVLIVGNMLMFDALKEQRPNLFGYHYVDIEEVSSHLIENFRPTLVLSLLMGVNFDAVEVASVLSSTEFDGVYGVVLDQAVSEQLIQNEISQAAPNIEVRMIPLDQLKPTT